MDFQENTINFPGAGKISAVFSEAIPGDLAKITLSRQGGQWFAALGLINVPLEAAKRLTNWAEISEEQGAELDLRFKQFENPLAPDSFAAFDASVVFGAVATSDEKTTYRLSTEEDRRRADEKLSKKKRYQKRFSRKQRHRQAEYNTLKGKAKMAPLAKGTKLPQSKRQKKDC